MSPPLARNLGRFLVTRELWETNSVERQIRNLFREVQVFKPQDGTRDNPIPEGCVLIVAEHPLFAPVREMELIPRYEVTVRQLEHEIIVERVEQLEDEQTDQD